MQLSCSAAYACWNVDTSYVPIQAGPTQSRSCLTQSDEAVRLVLAEAKKQNVNIHTIVSSADDVDYGNDGFDLVYAIFENGRSPSTRINMFRL
jgi:hypothetical protein